MLPCWQVILIYCFQKWLKCQNAWDRTASVKRSNVSQGRQAERTGHKTASPTRQLTSWRAAVTLSDMKKCNFDTISYMWCLKMLFFYFFNDRLLSQLRAGRLLIPVCKMWSLQLCNQEFFFFFFGVFDLEIGWGNMTLITIRRMCVRSITERDCSARQASKQQLIWGLLGRFFSYLITSDLPQREKKQIWLQQKCNTDTIRITIAINP